MLRVARTIADLEGAVAVKSAHVARAIQMRLLDRRVSAVNSPSHRGATT